jgi:subtilisin family serine protease
MTTIKTLFIFAILLTGIMNIYPVVVARGGDDPYIPNEVVIKLLLAEDIGAIATEYGLNPTPIDQFGSRPIFRMAITDGTLPPDKAAQLIADPGGRVVAADPNYISEIPEQQQLSEWAVGGSSTAYMGQWAPNNMHLDAAHTVATGAGIKIAVLDTGIDSTHSAFAGRVTEGFDFVDFDNDPSEEGNHEDDFGFGHGTHIAGLIALAAPDAQIIPIRILEPDGSGNLWVLIEGLEYAVQAGANVINLSIAFSRESDLLEDVLEDVICDEEDFRGDVGEYRGDECLFPGQQSIVVVASAGNTGDTTPQYPAAEDEDGLLSVAASTHTNTLAEFSTYGNWVHIAAPGANILSTVPNNQYATWNGTSMSAPLAAGVVALIREQEPLLTPDQIVNRIQTTAAPLAHPVVTRRLDAAAAVGTTPLPPAHQLWLPAIRQ